jgi:polyisoprenoid-binding protein YceI
MEIRAARSRPWTVSTEVATINPPERAILLHACLAAGLVFGFATAVAAAPRTYRIDAAASRIHVHVGRAGLFSFAGHEHEVVASVGSGEVVLDADAPARSSVHIEIPARSLRVTGAGEPTRDVPEVQKNMEGPKVLDVARFDRIVYVSRTVAARAVGDGVWDVEVVGDLTIRDATRSVPLQLRVTVSGDRLQAAGTVRVRQSAFGITPISVAGVVKVKDELELRIDAAATASGP